MQVCWNCGSQQMNGTIFCADCGASLLEAAQTQHETTASIAICGGHADVRGTPVVVPAPSSAAVTNRMHLVVINGGQRIPCDVQGELQIGREDKARGSVPDIDLGPYGGFDGGVSRRHARIIRIKEAYCIEDLGSANGTYLNGTMLAPRQPAPIRSGDELGFGTLLLRVEW